VIHSAVPVLASVVLGNPKKMGSKNYISFSIPVLTPPPPLRRIPQIVFDNRKKGDILNDCLMTVDGTDFRVPQKGTATKGNAFASHKYAGKSALRYKLGVSILGGDLVWIQGPYPAGKYNDIKIFNKVLRHFFDSGERVEADKGYIGYPDKIKCPQNVGNPAEKWAMQGRVMARHETLNGRLKNWGILSQVYRHDIMRHGEVFRACAVVTQLTIENGGVRGLDIK
jgi:hypothetical protein